jgi:ABC-type uncharacterized transport system substrate-binding protein
MRLRDLLLAWIALLVAAVPAAAHPHVKAETIAVFVFADKRLSEIRVGWHLDRAVSISQIRRFDRNGDGTLDGAEAERFRTTELADLGGVGFFTDLRIAGRRIPIRDLEQFAVDAEDGVVTYRFTVRLAAPVDIAAEAVTLSIYDPAYFVAMEPGNADAVVFEGDPPAHCGHRIGLDEANPLGPMRAFPSIIRLVCDPEPR